LSVPGSTAKRSWRSLKTKNLKLARRELHRRRCGLKPVEAASTVTCGDVIRRYQDDRLSGMTSGKPGPAACPRIGGEILHQPPSLLDKVPVDAVTNALRSVLRYIGSRSFARLKADRAGTGLSTSTLNTLSKRILMGHPLRDREIQSSRRSATLPFHLEGPHCRETMPHNSDELHKLAAVFFARRKNSACSDGRRSSRG